MRLNFLLIAILGLSILSNAQDSSPVKHIANPYHENPLWIEMMNNPDVNYHEARKAFYTHWQGKELPAESEGEANDLGNKEEEGLHFKDPNSYVMIYEYKRFKNWEKVNANHIDPSSGRVLTEEQQKRIWQYQTQGINTHIE